MKPQDSHFKHVFSAIKYSLQGYKAAWTFEKAFKQEVILCFVFIPLAFYLTPELIERLFLIGLCLLVLVVELLNSAIEAVVDRIGEDLEDFHPLSGRAKDLGSAAVMVLNLFIVICYVSFFIHYKL